jgi:molecular chaperone Hsp33
MTEKDQLHRFIFDNAPVRGEMVQLQKSWQSILERHEYPAVVRNVLGEAMAATVLLSATIKFLGSITLQIQGDGPVSMLVVQVKTDKTVRAMASYEDEEIQAGLKNMFGDAKLVITIEMENAAERYQGIVELGDEGIAEALEEYFHRSEQLETRLWLSADEHIAGGFLLQQMPGDSAVDMEEKDDWNRLVLLADTLKKEELTTLSVQEVLHRLYHEDDLRLFTPDLIEFSCSCSREKIEKTLVGLGYKEVKEILTEQGSVGVDCNFCNLHYEFDSIDVETIFADALMMRAPETHQ